MYTQFISAGSIAFDTFCPIITQSIGQAGTIWSHLTSYNWCLTEIETLNLILCTKVPEVQVAITSSCIQEILYLGVEPNSMYREQHILVIVGIINLMCLKSQNVIKLWQPLIILTKIRKIASSINGSTRNTSTITHEAYTRDLGSLPKRRFDILLILNLLI